MNEAKTRYYPKPLESVVLYLCGLGLTVFFSSFLAQSLNEDHVSGPVLFLTHLLAYGLTAGIGLFMKKRKTGTVRDIIAKNDFCWCMTASLVALALLSIILLWPLIFWLSPGEMKEVYLKLYTMRSFTLMAGIVLAAPLLEELIFRGLILKGSLHYLSPGKAIALSAVLFAFSHTTPAQIPAALLIGLGTGWLCYKVGSWLPGLVIHFVYNTGSFLLRFIYSEREIEMLLSGEMSFIPAVPWVVLWPAAFVIAAGIAFYLVKQVQDHTRTLET